MRQLDGSDEPWFFSYWRPALAWSYLFICLFDFVLAPIAVGLFCFYTHVPLIMWTPLTLQGGAVYHAAMGAISGVTSWQRSREKMAVLQSKLDNAPDDLSSQPCARRQGQDQ